MKQESIFHLENVTFLLYFEVMADIRAGSVKIKRKNFTIVTEVNIHTKAPTDALLCCYVLWNQLKEKTQKVMLRACLQHLAVVAIPLLPTDAL